MPVSVICVGKLRERFFADARMRPFLSGTDPPR